MLNKRDLAFTLAEVLIALTIIGVVAAITIPSLVQKTHDVELKTAWKKAYAELNQATISIMSENAGNLKNLCTSDVNNCLKDQYQKYFKVTKSCTDSTGSECWHASGNWSYLNGDPIVGWSNTASFASAEGFLYRFEAAGFPDCTNNSWVNNLPKCAFINVDINGFKKPNTVGKDIFFMILTENKILPIGSQGDTDHVDDCRPDSIGWGCAAKYLQE